MSNWDAEIKKTQALVAENKRRIAKSHKLLAEFRATLCVLRRTSQSNCDGLNPKIIPLPLSSKSEPQADSTLAKKQKPKS